MLDKTDFSVLNQAIQLIKAGRMKRADIGHGMVVYKVPSNNPYKYTIRMDIKVEETDNGKD